MKTQHQAQSDDNYYIDAHALVDEGVQIGSRTRIWAFAHIVTGAVIGEDCNICDHTFIEGKVVLGDRVTVKCGVYLWDGVIAEDDVFIGPAAVFTNDLKPRSKHDFKLVPTILKQGCSIGANSTILGGTVIGAWSLIGAGSVVTKDVPDYGVVWGNPAKLQYWMCQCTREMSFSGSSQFVCECGKIYTLNAETQSPSCVNKGSANC
jgi:acetyltransferase-like isoleucine patch superfamily enzyme